MAKSNRHKKMRKQEKAKTQLTGVKKLSKAKNVVEPTLRVKKIVIREQLKSSSVLWDGTTSEVVSNADAAGTRWKQNLQDLLAATNHHNVNIRKDAIVGLQELASSKSPLVVRNLDKLLGKIAAVTSDQERIVRRENVKLAGLVLSMISHDQLTPFWSMLIAHLKCTMTHLDVAVRYSSLPFVELLVDTHPLLVYESSSTLLPSLLGLVSTTYKANPNDNNVQKQKNVTKLKTEITGKHDDLTVRIKVLRLLSKCLKMSSVGFQEASKSKAERKRPENLSSYLSLRYPFGYHNLGQSEKEDPHTKSSGGSYTDRFYSTVTVDPYASVFSEDSIKKTTNNWHDFVNACVPVLVETWVEMGPSLADKGADNHGKSYGRNKGSKQSGFKNLGNDNDNKDMGRRNGLHILNETHVESMLSITILLEQLLQNNGICMTDDVKEQSQLAKGIKRTHGQNLLKHFFALMPYESVKESRRKDVIAINLKLFLIAGKLKIIDNSLKKKLQMFIEGVMGSSKLDEDHCDLILNAIRYLDVQKAQNLPTNFLISASKMGYHRMIVEYLIGFIHPSSYEMQKEKKLLEMMESLQWNELVLELVDTWPINFKLKHDELELQRLFELLTFVALRRLTDMNSIIRSCVPKLKDLVSTSELQSVRESAQRAFIYADVANLFESEVSANME